jgi:hypothetical protein
MHKSPAPGSGRLNFVFVRPNICGYSEWNFLHVTLPKPIILVWLLDFWGKKLCTPALRTREMLPVNAINTITMKGSKSEMP